MVKLTKTGQEKGHQIKHKISLRKKSDNMESINNIDDNIYNDEINDINRNQNSRINNRGQPETENSKSKNYDGIISWLILLLIICFVMLIGIIYQLWQFGYKGISIGIGIISVVSVIVLIGEIIHIKYGKFLSKGKSFKEKKLIYKNLAIFETIKEPNFSKYYVDSHQHYWFLDSNEILSNVLELNNEDYYNTIKKYEVKIIGGFIIDIIMLFLLPFRIFFGDTLSNPYTDDKIHTRMEYQLYDLGMISHSSLISNLGISYINELDNYKIKHIVQLYSCNNINEYIYYKNLDYNPTNETYKLLYWLYIQNSVTINFKDISTISLQNRFLLLENIFYKFGTNFPYQELQTDIKYKQNRLYKKDFVLYLHKLNNEITILNEEIKNFPIRNDLMFYEELYEKPFSKLWIYGLYKLYDFQLQKIQLLINTFKKCGYYKDRYTHCNVYINSKKAKRIYITLAENTINKNRILLVSGFETIIKFKNNEQGEIFYDEMDYNYSNKNKSTFNLNSINCEKDIKNLAHEYSFEFNIFTFNPENHKSKNNHYRLGEHLYTLFNSNIASIYEHDLDFAIILKDYNKILYHTTYPVVTLQNKSPSQYISETHNKIKLSRKD